MTDILIRGKEMPKSCRDCFVDINTAAFPACPLAENYAAGKALVADGLGHDIRPGECPLIPVPPHGRLIDAEVAEVISFNEEEADGKDFMDGILHAADWISKQPTIIPASEEGE